jgi:hypothetical protein
VNAPFNPSTSSLVASDREIIEQLKQQLDATTQRLQLSELRVQLLEEKLRLQRIAKYGPGSEKLTSLQLELLELEPGVSNLEVAAEGERDALPATPDTQKRCKPPIKTGLNHGCLPPARTVSARDLIPSRTASEKWEAVPIRVRLRTRSGAPAWLLVRASRRRRSLRGEPPER